MEKAALPADEARYRWLFETMSPGVVYQNGAGRIVSVNPAAERILGLPAERMIGKRLTDPDFRFIRADDSELPREAHPTILALRRCREVRDVRLGVFNPQTVAWYWIDASAVPLFRPGQKKPYLVYTMLDDVTEQKEAEEELKGSREQLRNLAGHLQSIREEERTRVAREIHDELGQVLTALKMDLSWLRKRFTPDQKALLDKVESMVRLTDITIKTVKRISTELRPGLLDDLGLGAAIEWQSAEFQERTGIRCQVMVDLEDSSLEESISTAIFRIFQETLTNVARHARATELRIELREKAGRLELCVGDNGRGITAEQIRDPKAFGLIGIRERAQFMQGAVKIRGIDGRGTSVLVSIPLSRAGR